MQIAIVGATGLVGQTMIKVLEESGIQSITILPAASGRSAGQTVSFLGAEVPIITIDQALEAKPDFALFAVSSELALEYAPQFVEAGSIVIDNSSAFRMDPNTPLVVPEVNGHTVSYKPSQIIANPNCSTIQLVVALAPLHAHFGLQRVVVSTYQAVSGAGTPALQQLHEEEQGNTTSPKAFPHHIHRNLFPQIDKFHESGYTLEELKVMNESAKILGIQNLPITCTAVRVPVLFGHSESVNVQLSRPATVEGIQALLNTSPGINLLDNPDQGLYPTPLTAAGNDKVWVGRIRADLSAPNTFNMWVVSDNVRKGAASNAVQILLQLVQHNYA